MGTAATGGASHRLWAVRPVRSSNGRASGGRRRATIYPDTGAIASGKYTRTRTQRCPHAIPRRSHSLNGRSSTAADANTHAYAANHPHGHAHARTTTHPHADSYLHVYAYTPAVTCSNIYAYTHDDAATCSHVYAYTHADGLSSTQSHSCHHRGHREH